MYAQQVLPIDEHFHVSLLAPEYQPKSPLVEAQIEEVWQEAQEEYGERLFNDQLLLFDHLEGRGLFGSLLEYRSWLAHVERPLMRAHLGYAGVGVRGLLHADGYLLFAKRSQLVGLYKGLIETAPGGHLSDRHRNGSQIDYQAHLLDELREETGIRCDQVLSIRPYALVWNDLHPALDICCWIEGVPELLTQDLHAEHEEYSEYYWYPKHEALSSLVPEVCVRTTHSIVQAGLAAYG